jgi:hypothetical protein
MPGKGFDEDYGKFYKKAYQSTLQFSYQAEKQNIQDPIDLVFYFYTRLYNSSDIGNLSVYSPKETDFARSILSTLSLKEAKDFVDFALAQAATTSFDVKTFMGVRQYLAAWPSAKKEFEGWRRKEEERKKVDRDEELKNLYQTFRQGEIKKSRESLSPSELTDIEKQVEAQLLKENPKVFGPSVLVRIRTNALLADRFRIPSFEEWKKSQDEK